jgi:transposase, IS5 family
MCTENRHGDTIGLQLEAWMYRQNDPNQMTFEDFYLPFGGRLRSENRWVLLSKQIPWDQVEQEYAALFADSDTGRKAKPARLALGALIIKERLGTTDRETVEQMRENPYLQYFLGFTEYKDKAPFDPSLMTHFRKRFGQEALAKINESIVLAAREESQDETCESDEPPEDPPAGNGGKLIVDATCTPADIRYPTDLNLLNEAREKSEDMIDVMHRPFIGDRAKPRTYRQKARQDYLAIVKQKRPGAKTIRKAVRKQLGYLRRNLQTIAKMASEGLLKHLSKRLYRLLLVIGELYRQQLWMYQNRSHRIEDRIVSLHQPHVRPIVRGKAGHPVEFGAKISVSLIDGFSFVETLSWDAFNESGDQIDQIEAYHRRFGCYPESVHADRIYRTRANRRYCRDHGIRLSGPPLGRPKVATESNEVELKKARRQQRQDERDRIPIEGKFGQGKRRFTLNRIMAKLAETSETVVLVSFIVMNLEKLLAQILLCVFVLCRRLSITFTAVVASLRYGLQHPQPHRAVDVQRC